MQGTPMSIPGINNIYPSLFPQENTSRGNNEHVMGPGETLDSVAKDYGVTPTALYEANPQIHPPVLLQAGMRLTIPDAGNGNDGGNATTVTTSGTAEAKQTTKTGTDANGTTSTTGTQFTLGNHGNVTLGGSSGHSTTTTDANGTKSVTGSNTSGSVDVDPDAGTISLSGGTGFSKEVTNSKGRGVSFGVNANATAVTGKKTENGVTTYNASTDVSVSLNAGVKSKQAGLEVGHTEGIKSSFEVSMPEAAAKSTDLSGVNPFDPSSMPTGTTIKIDGSNYTTNEFKATFKNLAVQTKVTDASGTSMVVKKTGDTTVRVTAGPTQAVDAYNGVGVDFGVASAMLGRDDQLSGATLKTAEFDLSTPEGKAAFNDFAANGNLPSDNGTGISNVKTIQKLDYSSQAKIDAKLGPIEFGIGGAKNTGSSVVVTEPDGSMTRTVNLQYSDNVPMTISQTFDAAGNEITSARTYSYTFKVDGNNAQMINTAQTGSLGNTESGPVKPGQTIAITYTQADMEALLGDAQNTAKASHGRMDVELGLPPFYADSSISAKDFAVNLARNMGSTDFGAAQRLYNISRGADGDNFSTGFTALPGTISVIS